MMEPVIRAEHVGSMLRPPEVLQARSQHDQGNITLEQLREVEDQAALANIKLQHEAGMRVFTDGEVRRASWMADLLESIGGLVAQGTPPGLVWHRDHGPEPAPEETQFTHYVATEKVTRQGNLTQVEAGFLAKHVPERFKLTMMSASMGNVMWSPELSRVAYPEPNDLVDDLARLQAEEIKDLVRSGVTWIQLDSLSYGWLIDQDFAEQLRSMGISSAARADKLVALDNMLVQAAKTANPQVTVALHFCRGNNRSSWLTRGSYEPVAEKLFGGVDVDRFLLEYDTERAGGFEPLRFVPRGKTVVLGLVSSKVTELEGQEELCRRIDEASKYVPLEYLALSPQCGFASTAAGNLLSADEQRRKLELVVDTAHKVWGSA
jgi:5-methyltetrahydropteroyltriglutamate--homocysteine methyltransferase